MLIKIKYSSCSFIKNEYRSLSINRITRTGSFLQYLFKLIHLSLFEVLPLHPNEPMHDIRILNHLMINSNNKISIYLNNQYMDHISKNLKDAIFYSLFF